MKVKCIGVNQWLCRNQFIKKWPWSKRQPKPYNGPKKDEIVTVEGEYYSDGIKYYRLLEWPLQGDGGYEASYFVPIDEYYSEFKEVTFEKIKEKVPVLSEN